MTAEPLNAASERLRAEMPRWDDPEYVKSAGRAVLAADFSREDRRRLIAMPTGDVDAYLESFDAWYEVGDGQPKFNVEEVIGVRGERLVLTRTRVSYASGQATEFLYLFQFDQRIDKVERQVAFDLDDVDAALDELGEIQSALDRP